MNALAKTGALRHSQLPVSATGSGRCSCLLRLADFCGAGRCPLAKIRALRQPRLRCFVHWTRLARLPLGTKFSSEPRTRLRLAHSRLKISLSVSRPYAHVVRPGRFGKSGLSCFYPIAKRAGRQVYMGRPAAGRGSRGGKILPISQKRCRFFVDSGARVWYNQRRP